MSIGPKIINDGLIFYADPFNAKCYVSGSSLKNMVDDTDGGTLYNGVNHNGKSWVLDGISDRIYLNTINATLSECTYNIWINHDLPLSAGHHALGTTVPITNDAAFAAYMHFGNGQTTFKTRPVGEVTSDILGQATPESYRTANVPHYFSFVMSTTQMKFYIDGDWIATKTRTLSGDIVIHGFNVGLSIGYGTYKGEIGGASLYDTALTIEEIQQNYNTLKGRFGIT